MKVTPRPYQRTAVKAALEGLRGRFKRALVVLATGLGKTLAAAFITKQYGSKRTLFLAHSNFILDHAMGEFRKVFDERTTISVFNGLSKDGAGEADIVFATWQTMGKNLKLWKRNHFDLVIVDEAHHTEARTYRPVAKYFLGAHLGITATPDRADKADIRGIFGPEVANVPLEEAISHAWLPRIEYHVITDESLDNDQLQKIAEEIRESKRRFTMAEVNRRIFIQKRDEEIARIIEGYPEKTIVFCPSIRYAGKMKKFLRLAAVFHSTAGAGQKDTWDKNQKTLDELNNGIVRRVCAVNAFNEGVNVPTVGLVAFCRVTDSLTIFRQQLGRGLRPGKEKLIVLDFVGNLERIKLLLELIDNISKPRGGGPPSGGGNERERFEVSGKGFAFTFSNQIVDLMEVLNHCERDFYPTWQEASQAAVELGFRSMTQYQRGYCRDSKLSSRPERTYPDYPGDTIFFGRKEKVSYNTWRQASRAAIALSITSILKYRAQYKADPLLPGEPSDYDGFPGWRKFLGQPERLSPYPSFQAAQKAVRGLGVTTMVEYHKRYKEDPRLPSRPSKRYEQKWNGWTDFLGSSREFYLTITAASRAAKRLKIRNQIEYSIRYKEDPRLPSTPSNFYKDTWKVRGWGWMRFLGKKK